MKLWTLILNFFHAFFFDGDRRPHRFNAACRCNLSIFAQGEIRRVKYDLVGAGSRIRITLLRIPIQLFISMRIRILLLIKVMRICDHWPTDPPSSILSVNGPLWLHIEPQNLLIFFYLNADPGPAFHSTPDPDSASINNADPSGSKPWIGVKCNAA